MIHVCLSFCDADTQVMEMTADGQQGTPMRTADGQGGSMAASMSAGQRAMARQEVTETPPAMQVKILGSCCLWSVVKCP